MKNNLTFNQFCKKYCDDMYTEGIEEEKQCSGYKLLKQMIIDKIEPVSEQESIRWETNPISEELLAIPDLKYLRFLHPNLRPYIRSQWDFIKTLKIQ